MMYHLALLKHPRPFSWLIGIALLAVLVFEVVMFVSVLRNNRINNTTKIWWVMGMLLIHPFVAIIYYFTDYKRVG